MAYEQTVEHVRNEQRRHQYLAAMGVTSWLPRAVMPSAKPSSESVYQFLYGHEEDDFDSQDDGTDVSIIDDGIHTTHAKAPVTAASLDLLTPSARSENQQREVVAHDNAMQCDSTQTDVMSSIPAALQTKAHELLETDATLLHVSIEPRTVKQKAPRFRLGFWSYKDVLVVDSLPLLSRGGITQAKYQILCANMIKAMGLDAELLAAPYVLAWPMLAGDSLDQGKEQASLAVNHKIHKLLQDNTPRLMLFLGESAAQMVMQREESIDELRAVVFSYSTKIKAITSLSLTHMLQIPECKKEVWSDLQKVLPVDV